MKGLLKGKIATVIILLATFILAGVAVFTAIRLYQLRQVPVAPNVPESQPEAVATNPPVLCSLSFAIATPTPTPSPTPSPTPTPVPQCNSTCTTNNECLNGMTCSGGNCRNAACTSQTNCICPTPTPTATPTPTPSPTPTATPTASPTPSPTPVVTHTPSPTPSPTPTQVPQCNNNCTSNSACPSDLFCDIADGAASGNCRNASCTSKTDCICSTTTPTATPTRTPTPTSTYIAFAPTPTPTQPALPQSGTDWTTYFGIVIGIITIIGSLMLAL